MPPTDIDEAWPPPASEPAEVAPADLIDGAQTTAHAPPPVAARVATVDADPRDDVVRSHELLAPEQLSVVLVVFLGCVVALLLQMERLRRELRALTALAPRRL